jgi:uncharacterized protein
MENVINESDRNRYVLETADGQAIADYVISGNEIIFTHTNVPRAMEGKGIASRLIKTALSDSREAGMKVVPQCSFVRVYIDRHPEWQDLLA